MAKMKLIIVESPTKSRTISQFLGKDFLVESCYGHIRDLPKGKMGIEIENNFKPIYVIPTNKRRVINKLKKIARQKEIYLATDEDREGEAIAYHLEMILKNEKLNQIFLRICFHEITKEAIEEALKNPRKIDMNLVEAQQARRILDRLVGYELSPLLWKKIARRLSAGRVQSPALRLVVEREREIEKFKPEEYWTIVATLVTTKLRKDTKVRNFKAMLYKVENKILDKFAIKTKNEADEILKNLEGANYSVNEVKQRETSKYPLPPFITSTLQQAANQRFGYSTKKTMFIAQQLYEGIKLGKEGLVGLITYMRTDSFNLAEKFLNETRKYLQENFSSAYLPDLPRHFKVKSRIAQEAHEAIRPTSIYREPEKIKNYLTKDQFKIYDLIWRRVLASQMTPAKIVSTFVKILAKKQSLENHYFKTTGSQIKFDGWLKIYPTKIGEMILPALEKNEDLDLIKIESIQHFTQPPVRYSEAELVKTLEKYKIGRPSTYAPIISTLFERNYISKERGRLIPTEIGKEVNDLLVKHFPRIVDYQFTAKMEEDLDEIAQGKLKMVPMLNDFYWPFKKEIEKKEREIKKEKIEEETTEVCLQCGKPMKIKFSRFGKFLACSGFPKCRFVKSLNLPKEENLNLKCPKCEQGKIVRKRTKKGRFFFACNRWPNCDFASWQKPTTSS